MDAVWVWVQLRLLWIKNWPSRFGILVKSIYQHPAFIITFVAIYLFGLFVLIPLSYPQRAHAATIARRSETNNNASSATSVVINKPAGVVSGDVLVAAVATDAGGAWSPPSGWTQVQTVTNTAVVAAWYLVAGGSEPSSYTFGWTNTTQGAGGIVAYTGVNNSNPIDFIGTTNTGSSASVVSNASNTVHDDSMVIGVYGGRSAGVAVSYTPPGTMTERVDASSGSNAAAIEMTEENVTTAGSYASKTATCSRSESFGAFVFSLRPTGTNSMMLFWDGGSAPTGWTTVTAYNGSYPRGDVPANFGKTGSDLDVTTTSSVTTSGADVGLGQLLGCGPCDPTYAHNHGNSATVTIGAASNSSEPAYRSLKLIKYNSGIPQVIPAGAIAFFSSGSSAPSGWTRQSAQDSKFVKVDSSVATGGSDTHTHSLTWSSLSADATSSNQNNFLPTAGAAAAIGHTHTAPAATTTGTNGTDTCAVAPGCLPLYVEPLMAKADSDTASIPIDMIAMFDGDPGAGWFMSIVLQGVMYRPASTASLSNKGSATHSHANATSGNSGTNNTSSSSNTGAAAAIAANGHHHTITAVFNPLSHNTPAYFDVVVAMKQSFTLNAYRWYVDSAVEDVTDPWASIDIAQNTPIKVTPVADDAPGSGRVLRLRMNLVVGTPGLSTSSSIYDQFKLQYRASTDSSCTNGSWTDVGAGGSGSIWRYATSSITNGSTISTSRLSPSSDVLEQYVKSSSPGNNPNDAFEGNTIEYDYHIQQNSAATATQYSFRLIETNGYILGAYTVCPALDTLQASGDQLRHGDVFVGGSDRGFTWAD